ncbi:MAG: hypothetical protein EKK64_11145 [Neisseriaceae bacterium]|nr:MAG: hypothetical protein EKK64_11145 [Neisseriaceae bacterium]
MITTFEKFLLEKASISSENSLIVHKTFSTGNDYENKQTWGNFMQKEGIKKVDEVLDDNDKPFYTYEYINLNNKYKVGQKVRHHYGAPGIGYIDYEVTKIDDQGVWAKIIANTGRVLDPEETY